MMGKSDNGNLRVRNCGGIPVLEVVGELNTAALKAIESAISTLSSAGHYHIVLNIQKAVAANLKVMECLKDSASRVVKHYGAIDVVGEAGQISQLLGLSGLAKMLRFCTSENEALRRIKRLTRRPEGNDQGCSARIMEIK